MSDEIEVLAKLDKQVRAAARLLDRDEVRHLVKNYYQIQKYRKSLSNQKRATEEKAEPNDVILWFNKDMRKLEENIRRLMGEFAASYKVGQWLQSITGIGPVISAGLLAHLDIREAKNAGHFWSFAGINPTMTWEKGKKRPWNAELKRLWWLAADCFVKFSNHPKQYYGTIYNNRKNYETNLNNSGKYRDLCQYILTGKCPRFNGNNCIGRIISPINGKEFPCMVCQNRPDVKPKNYRMETDARKWYDGTWSKDSRFNNINNDYKGPMLPPAHIHSRCLRYTAKMFLSHIHHVMYRDYYGTSPEPTFALTRLPGDHRHYVEPPNLDMEFDGKDLKELYIR